MSDTFAWVFGTPAVVGLAVLAVLRIRALNARIREHFEEEEKGIVKNPYEQMAALFEVEEAVRREKRKREP